ncbi:hypothetical protein ABBQ38_014789 [Trebouxia sp. C0009 RCD-2024]
MRRGNRSQATNTGLVSLLLMLGNQIRRMDQKPPVTIALVAVQVLLFAAPTDLANLIPPISNACLHPYKVFEHLELSRILWSAFLHADESHIFYNMSSLLWKGAQLEPLLGSTKFALVLLELLVSSHLIMVMLAKACVTFAPAFAGQYYNTCAVGFSAVLFAMKVVLNSNSPGWSSVAGISLPTKYVTWAELIYIQLLTPNASFLGHLAGILAGILHVTVLQRLPMLRSGPTPFTGQGRYAHDPDADPDATAAGGTNSPGPRRSARFAKQQKPNSSSGQQQSATPGSRQPGTGTTQLQRSWLQTFVWIAWAALAVLVAVMAATNPSRAAFVDSISQLTSRGLGQWAGGEEFRMLAGEMSECTSRIQGGLVGWIERGQMAPMFEQAAFEADIGELVRAETHFGLHLIKVEAEREQAGIAQMSVSKLAEILKDPQQAAQVQLVDVREDVEARISSLPEFQVKPLSRMRQWGPVVTRELDTAKHTIIMCHHGMRSQQAAEYFQSLGFAQLSNVEGGIHAYSLEIDPAVPIY